MVQGDTGAPSQLLAGQGDVGAHMGSSCTRELGAGQGEARRLWADIPITHSVPTTAHARLAGCLSLGASALVPAKLPALPHLGQDHSLPCLTRDTVQRRAFLA